MIKQLKPEDKCPECGGKCLKCNHAHECFECEKLPHNCPKCKGSGEVEMNSLEEKVAEVVKSSINDGYQKGYDDGKWWPKSGGHYNNSDEYYTKKILTLISESQKDTHIALDEVVMVKSKCRDLYRCGKGFTVSRNASCYDKCKGTAIIEIPKTVRDILKESH